MPHYRKAFREDLFRGVTKGGRERRRDRAAGHVPLIRTNDLGDGRMVCERCGLPVERFKEFRCQPR